MWKLNKKMAALVALLPAAYCHYDTQALPRAVDIAGGIVGDGSILFLEKRVFGVSGWANERLCSTKLRMGLAKPHPAAVTPLPAPKADPAPAWLGALAAGRRDRDFFYVTKSLSEQPQGQRPPADPGSPPTRPPDPP